MQKNPETPKEAEAIQAEGELPEGKLAEVSGGSPLTGLLNTAGTTTALDLLKLQNSANQAAQNASSLTDAINTFANTAGNTKNIG